MTKEMIQLLNQLTDLADEASVTIYDDGKEKWNRRNNKAM